MTIKVGDTVKCISPGPVGNSLKYGKYYHVIEVEKGSQRKVVDQRGPLVTLEGHSSRCYAWRFEKVMPKVKPQPKSTTKSTRRKP